MQDRSLLLQYMGDTPKLRIIDFFLDNAGSDYSKKEIIEHTGISKTTFYKIWDEVMQFGFLKATRKFGKAQLYSLNSESELILKFKALDGELARQAMQKALEPYRQDPALVARGELARQAMQKVPGPIPAREPLH